MPRTLEQRTELHNAGFFELRGPTGRLRGWYNPQSNMVCFMDRKDARPEYISLCGYKVDKEKR